MKIKTQTIIITISIIIIALVITIFLSNYFVSKNNFFSKIPNRILPFPAANVGTNNFISIKILEDNLNSSKRFYENQDFSKEGIRIDFSTEEGKKRLQIKEKNIFNKLIENEIIKEILKNKGIKISEEAVSQELNRKISELGEKDKIQENIFKLYGWNLETFEERIVRPSLEKEKLAEKVLEEEKYLEKNWEKINKAKERIETNQKFEDIAKELSEGESAKSNGDLGWFFKEQMLPEISDIAFKLEKGAISDIIKSRLGLHIIKVEDIKIEDEVPMIKVRQIFVRTPTFADWLIKESKDIPVRLMINGYIWNKDEMHLEFEDESMKKMEGSLLDNFSGDISVIF